MNQNTRWKATTKMGIYVASRAKPEIMNMWRGLRDNAGWKITSSWIDQTTPLTADEYPNFWSRVGEEIRESDGLILYVRLQEDLPLKGALIETGIALECGLPVVIVANTNSHHYRPDIDSSTGLTDTESAKALLSTTLGSWVYHKNVLFNDTIGGCRYLINKFNQRIPE